MCASTILITIISKLPFPEKYKLQTLQSLCVIAQYVSSNCELPYEKV